MFWFTFFMFVVSFLLTVFLAPKPELEDARASRLSDIRFPRADAGTPVPMIFGQVRLRSPNTLWYGAFFALVHKKKVKTGIFSSEHVITGYSYHLSFDLGLCTGPDVELHLIYNEKKVIWGGNVSGDGVSVVINKPSLFGGNDRGGGLQGNCKFYSGDFTHTKNQYLMTGWPNLGTKIPAYNGICRLVFESRNTTIYLPGGFDPVTITTPFYIGNNANLRPFSFVLSRYPDNLGLASPQIGVNLNPMELLYSLLTEEWGGLGIDPSDIDTASFLSVGATLLTEVNGMSIVIDKNNTVKTIVEEVLRQVDGILYQDPATGKIKVRLIREDYDIESLPIFDESNIKQVRNFSRTSWAETYNQVRVKYNQRTRNYEEATAFVQDMANIEIQGRIKTLTVSLPGVTEEQNAVNIASRVLSQRNVPLFSAQIEAHRDAQGLVPGDPFIFKWDDYSIVQTVMRVQRFDFGELIDGRIVMDVVQDTFAVSDTLYGAPEDTLWDPEDRSAVDITEFQVFETFYWFLQQLDPDEFTIIANMSYYWALPHRPQFMEDFTFQTSRDVFVQDVVNEIQTDFPMTCLLKTKIHKHQGQNAAQLTRIEVYNTDPVGNIFSATTQLNISQTGVNLLRINGEWMSYLNSTDIYSAYTLNSIGAIGADYAVNDTITLASGTFREATILTVNSVDGNGGVLSASITDIGVYTTAPSSPVPQGSTSGIGSGANFHMTYTIQAYDLTTVYRAMMDTNYENHAIDDVVYVIQGSEQLSRVGRPDTGTTWYQLLTASDQDAQETGDPPTNTIVNAQAYDLPAPPDRLTLESIRCPIELIGITDVDFDWRERNRTDANLYWVTDATDISEGTTTYNTRVYIDGDLIDSSSGVGGTTDNLTGLAGSGILRGEVEAVRAVGTSLIADFDECFYANYLSQSSELVVEGDFEGIALLGWTVGSGSWNVELTNFPLDNVQGVGAPNDNEHLVSTGTTNEIYQEIDITSPDYRGMGALFRIWKGGKIAGVTGQVKIEQIDDPSTILETITTPLVATELGVWELIEIPVSIRTDCDTIRITIIAPNADSVWDNASFKANTVYTTQSSLEYDTITNVTVEGAWGLRQMDSGYSGAIVKIRDTYDDTETDIYANPDGDLDSYYTRGDARVVKLYDQSGNGAHLEPRAVVDQPRLIHFLSETGRPAISFDSSNANLVDPTVGTTRPYMVARPNASLVMSHKRGTVNAYMANVPYRYDIHSSPYTIWGLSHGSTDWRWAHNSSLELSGSGSNSGKNVCFADYQNGFFYLNNDAASTDSWTAEDITWTASGADTHLVLTETAAGGQPWQGISGDDAGNFYELCIFSGNIAAGDRQTIMETIALYWFDASI